jgi:hypothetical protein
MPYRLLLLSTNDNGSLQRFLDQTIDNQDLPPFSNTNGRFCCPGNLIVERTGVMWAIPKDGRIGLTLSPVGLGFVKPKEKGLIIFRRASNDDSNDSHDNNCDADSDKKHQGDAELKVQRLKLFDTELSGIENCDFYVFGYDPWTGGSLIFRPSEQPPVPSSHSSAEWDIRWENQDINRVYDILFIVLL